MVNHSYNTAPVLPVVIVTDIIDEEGPHGSPVVGGGDGSVSLLACRVPDLSFDSFPVNLDGSCGELHSDG